MADKKANFIDPESEVWNIAKGFTNFSVLALLIEINNLVKVARFGYERISEKYTLTPVQMAANRVEALARIEDNLRQLYENTYFVMKEADKKTMDECLEKLDAVKEVLDAITTETTDQRTQRKSFILNEDHFNLCLTHLRQIKRDMHTPLNNSQLIFPTTEELDFSKLEEELIHGG